MTARIWCTDAVVSGVTCDISNLGPPRRSQIPGIVQLLHIHSLSNFHCNSVYIRLVIDATFIYHVALVVTREYSVATNVLCPRPTETYTQSIILHKLAVS